MTFLFDLLAATLRNATPLVYGTVGETYAERSGVLNLGIEGTMYAGAFAGFAAAWATGSPLMGLAGRDRRRASLAGARHGLMTVTLGANQHVSGIGLTIGLIGLSEFVNRLLFPGGELQRIEPMPILDPFGGLGRIGAIFNQYAPDLGRLPGRRAGGLVAPQALALRPGDPGRRREPRGGRRGRASTSPGPATWR